MRLKARFLGVCAALGAAGASATAMDACVNPTCIETATCPDSEDAFPTSDQTLDVAEGGGAEGDSTMFAEDAQESGADRSVDSAPDSAADAKVEDAPIVNDSASDSPTEMEAGPCTGTCTTPAPPGWYGPGALFDGVADAGDQCTLWPYTQQQFLQWAGPSSPPLSCSCQCGAPSSDSCTTPSITVYSDNECVNPCGSAGSEACTTADGTKCSSGGQSAGVTALPTASGQGTCDASAVQTATPPPPSWSHQGEGCLPTVRFTTSGCGDAGLLCASPPPSGFVPQLCIWFAGDVSCPDAGPYQLLYRQYFGGYLDGRTCSQAGCSCAPPNVTCSLVGATSFSSLGCGGATTSLTHLGVQSGLTNCNMPANVIESMTATTIMDGGCSPIGSANSMGTVSQDPSQGVTTVCCAQ